MGDSLRLQVPAYVQHLPLQFQKGAILSAFARGHLAARGQAVDLRERRSQTAIDSGREDLPLATVPGVRAGERVRLLYLDQHEGGSWHEGRAGGDRAREGRLGVGLPSVRLGVHHVRTA